VKVAEVRKVLGPSEIQPVATTSEFVFGRIQVEGHHEIILDPARLFGEKRPPSDEFPRVILVRTDDRDFGFAADSVDEVVEVPEDSVRPPAPFIATTHGGVIQGTVAREEEEVLILDLGRLLETSGATAGPEDRTQG
jgi:purine-binding chemotaxis protein CheW